MFMDDIKKGRGQKLSQILRSTIRCLGIPYSSKSSNDIIY